MKHRRLKKGVRRAIEITVVAAVTVATFIVCRKAGVQERGNALWGGEIVVAVMIPAMYAAGKSIIRDIKSGLFR